LALHQQMTNNWPGQIGANVYKLPTGANMRIESETLLRVPEAVTVHSVLTPLFLSQRAGNGNYSLYTFCTRAAQSNLDRQGWRMDEARTRTAGQEMANALLEIIGNERICGDLGSLISVNARFLFNQYTKQIKDLLGEQEVTELERLMRGDHKLRTDEMARRTTSYAQAKTQIKPTTDLLKRGQVVTVVDMFFILTNMAQNKITFEALRERGSRSGRVFFGNEPGKSDAETLHEFAEIAAADRAPFVVLVKGDDTTIKKRGVTLKFNIDVDGMDGGHSVVSRTARYHLMRNLLGSAAEVGIEYHHKAYARWAQRMRLDLSKFVHKSALQSGDGCTLELSNSSTSAMLGCTIGHMHVDAVRALTDLYGFQLKIEIETGFDWCHARLDAGEAYVDIVRYSLKCLTKFKRLDTWEDRMHFARELKVDAGNRLATFGQLPMAVAWCSRKYGMEEGGVISLVGLLADVAHKPAEWTAATLKPTLVHWSEESYMTGGSIRFY